MLDLLTVGPNFTRPACLAAAAAVGRYLLPAPDLSSKPAGRAATVDLRDKTDRKTVGRKDTPPFHDDCRILCGLRHNSSRL